MRWFVLCCVLALLGIGCSGASRTEAEGPPTEPPPPPPPQPQAEPRVWDNEPSYSMGWPITVRVGILNTGETVVNVPDGESFGVTMRARRVDQQAVAAPEAAPEAAPAAAPASAEGGEAAAPASGEGAGAPAAEGGAPPAVEAAPPPPPAPPPIECEAIPAGSPQDGVAPLATGSSAYRSIQIDRQ